ncbi:mechanosensitive ion channel family protein [Methyloprofundus sedimenti]|uniref:mechanosensitive ion channel family protein n=1 Tax=Methyloprofundus sedimenti TaxID=1420851 RepID=UPI0009B5D981|nr:mechanosensitive ion channel domain-containing protein [Methyloprofundus sedimenti]
MSFSNTPIESITPFLPLFATLIFIGPLLWVSHQILIARHPDIGNERLFPRQLAMLVLTFAGVIGIALTLPVSESSRNQIIALIGLIISGIFAFSSSTIFANLMAGIMLRVTKPFSTGDFIKVGEYFGRVVERGLLDTEIQTENRELVALPNTYMITNPISVTRSSGTIISTTLSLGYDIHHSKVESLLLDAAKECGLEEPFIQILELGNYSITYKVNGMLTDVKSLLTARSNLCRYVLDTLHGNGVEIMSPAFMNQRRLPEDFKIIPADEAKQEPIESVSVAEEVVFDKAEKAEQTEKLKQQFLDKIKECKTDLEKASEEDKERLEEIIRESNEQLKALEKPHVEPSQDELTAEYIASADSDTNQGVRID